MARTVNEDDYVGKRNGILDAVQRLVYTKGYERMTIQDILDEVRMSSGAFYHYFASKPAALEAFITRIRDEAEKPLLPIIRDPQLSAIEKLRGFFSTLNRLRTANQATVLELLRVWYTDENAIVRQKVDDAVREQRAPLLNAIVRQGIADGVFTTPYPEQAGAIILALLHGMENTHAHLLLSLGPGCDEAQIIADIITTHAAYMEAIERVLGAPARALERVDADAVRAWVTAVRGHDHA